MTQNNPDPRIESGATSATPDRAEVNPVADTHEGYVPPQVTAYESITTLTGDQQHFFS